jgi:hypothetical protein
VKDKEKSEVYLGPVRLLFYRLRTTTKPLAVLFVADSRTRKKRRTNESVTEDLREEGDDSDDGEGSVSAPVAKPRKSDNGGRRRGLRVPQLQQTTTTHPSTLARACLPDAFCHAHFARAAVAYVANSGGGGGGGGGGGEGGERELLMAAAAASTKAHSAWEKQVSHLRRRL